MDKNSEKIPKNPSSVVKYLGMGMSLLALILIPSLIGNALDHFFKNSIPWITLVFSLGGISLSLFYVYKELKN